ncbi:MAG: penicillin-binding protein 2 [Bacilli bacterium]|nr:penicillin-binding protein 2 [Bacilli bacterium]
MSKRKTKKLHNVKKEKNVFIDEKVLHRRVFVLFIFVVLLFSILFFKLFDVMVLKMDVYKKSLKELSYTIVEGQSAPRGRIYDRNYNLLVDNKAVKTIFYKKDKTISTKKEIELAYKVSSHLNLKYEKLTDRQMREFYLEKYPNKIKKRITEEEWKRYEERKISNKEIEALKLERIKEEELNSFTEEDRRAAYLYYLMNNGYLYDEKVVKTGEEVTEEEYAYIAENNQSLDGFGTKLDWERTYPYGEVFRSILGTISTTEEGIPASEKSEYLAKGYSLNDRVGLSYIEKVYENYLKGIKEKYRVISSHELKLVSSGKRGNDIVLSIDIHLQMAVENILKEQILSAKQEPNTTYYDHSSVIIQEPNTGEILAMSSQKLVGDQLVDNTTSILSSPITPGSVVKGASMLVAYNTGAVKIGEYMLDECIKVAGTPQKCSSNTLGRINDITALAKSSNVYQFKAAIRVNGQEYFNGMRLNFNQKAFDTYREMYHSFGLGVKTEIDLPMESAGFTSKDVAAGNLLDFVMGQYETYTPLQLSQYVTTIANGGTRLAPHLLREVHTATDGEELGEVMLQVEPRSLNKIDTTPEYMARMKEGFYAVMHADGGYGKGYIEDHFDAAGKTGTSQSFIDTNNDGKIDTDTITSSFVGYAPANNPKMSIIVTSPDSSHPNSGSDFASLVTMRITKAVTNKFFELYPLQ